MHACMSYRNSQHGNPLSDSYTSHYRKFFHPLSRSTLERCRQSGTVVYILNTARIGWRVYIEKTLEGSQFAMSLCSWLEYCQ